MTYLWPDVSNVNGRAIDGALAKSQGMSAICAKATEGTGFRDGYLAANFAQAQDNGLPFMAYHFLYDGNGAGQADYFVTYVKEIVGDTPVGLMCDREQPLSGPIPDVTTTNTFLSTVKSLTGVTPCIYQGSWVVADAGACDPSYPLIWPAYVGGSGSPQAILNNVTQSYFPAFGGYGSYAGRQFTSSASIGGISPCDCNVAWDQATFDALFNQGQPAQLAPASVPVPPPVLRDADGHPINAPFVAGANTPSGNGYWLVCADGGVFTLGDAEFYGCTANSHLNKPIVDMASTPTGKGYWLVGADGGVFTFGDATYYGSTGGTKLNEPIVNILATPSGNGYWLVAADGGIFTFGDAHFEGVG